MLVVKIFTEAKPVFDVLVQLAQNFRGYLPQEHQVVGVVGVGVVAPYRGALLYGLVDVNSRVLNGEIQQAGGASEQSGAADLLRRRRRQVAFAHDGGRDVGVGLDAPGHDYLAGGVDDSGHVVGQGIRGGHRHDLFPLDRHVPIAHSPGGNDLAAADDQVQHNLPSFSYEIQQSVLLAAADAGFGTLLAGNRSLGPLPRAGRSWEAGLPSGAIAAGPLPAI